MPVEEGEEPCGDDPARRDLGGSSSARRGASKAAAARVHEMAPLCECSITFTMTTAVFSLREIQFVKRAMTRFLRRIPT